MTPGVDKKFDAWFQSLTDAGFRRTEMNFRIELLYNRRGALAGYRRGAFDRRYGTKISELALDHEGTEIFPPYMNCWVMGESEDRNGMKVPAGW